MPEYEELVSRALNAQEQARTLTVEAARVSRLARILREARADTTMLLHCAWCGRLQVGDEWLRLEAIGRGQMRIAKQIVRRSTHGICPDCFERVNTDTEAHRSSR